MGVVEIVNTRVRCAFQLAAINETNMSNRKLTVTNTFIMYICM